MADWGDAGKQAGRTVEYVMNYISGGSDGEVAYKSYLLFKQPKK